MSLDHPEQCSATHQQTPPHERRKGTPSLRLRAMNLLARREHSQHELVQKLAKFTHSEHELVPVIDQLNQEGLQSDERFCEDFIAYRSRSYYGPQKIRQELLYRGVANTLVETALGEADVDWAKQAFEWSQRKYSQRAIEQPKERQKLYAALIRRGFNSDQIRQVLSLMSEKDS